MGSPAVAEVVLACGLLLFIGLGCVIGPLYTLSRGVEQRRVHRASLASERDRTLRPLGDQEQQPDLRVPTGFPTTTVGSSRRPSFGGDR